MIPSKLFHDALYQHYNADNQQKINKGYNVSETESIKAVMLTDTIMLAEMPAGMLHCLVIYKPWLDSFFVEDGIQLPSNWAEMKGI